MILSLNDPVSKLHLVGPAGEIALKSLGIKTVQDLLYHFPRDWQDLSQIQTIAEARPNEKINIRAKVKKFSQHRTPRRRINLTQTILEDKTGNILAVWFNQPFLRNVLQEGKEYYFSGKAQVYETLQLQNPSFELVKENTIHTAGIIPVYELTEGITQKQIRYWLKQTLPLTAKLPDVLPSAIRTRLDLSFLPHALQGIHFPKNSEDLSNARHRLAFEELFLFQLALQSFKVKLKLFNAPTIALNTNLIKKFVLSLPFALTNSQRIAAWEILNDLKNSYPMNRLLEGEVGSGKTVVAGIAMLEVATAGWQSVLLAPTEILAWQHYQTLKELFENTRLEIALLTRSQKLSATSVIASEAKQSQEIAAPLDKLGARNDILLNNIASGQTKIIIGTHALLQEHVKFKKIGLLVVDEQHRFGVNQRKALVRGQTQTESRTDADKNFIFEDLTYKIRGCGFNVKEKLGLGHKEIIYQNALETEFKEADLEFKREKPINVIYEGKKIGTYQPDFIVESKIIVEIKALPFIGNSEKRQIWTYLKGSPFKLALLINFSATTVDIIRIVYDTAREGQRKSAFSLRESALVPHLLSMTATPIPRTLALAFYGDLDISQLRELPRGRKKIITKLVEPDKRGMAYEFIRKEILKGRQVYVVTPLIGEPDSSLLPLSPRGRGIKGEGVKAAVAEAEKLKKIFPEFQIGLLHGRMPAKGGSASGGKASKEQIMNDFREGKIDILVTTTVIEVGVDIPNAAIMIIENAERFGLAQLHQLRGRVGRAEHQSYCLLFAEDPGELTRQRLEAVVNSNDGFELAEKDLELRGPGEVMGTRQSGYIPFKIAKLSDRKLIKLAKDEAAELLKSEPQLTKFPLLKQKVEALSRDAHLE